ncbi:MAG: aminodeoxychorismate synthase component I [Bacteroidales bacterium]|nr:aminodeoxychorismate synthase component I [Bacteroidales bacterium]
MKSTVKDTILRMNEMGKNGQAFFFMVDFLKHNIKLYLPNEFAKEGIWISIPGYTNRTQIGHPSRFFFKKHPIDYTHYLQAFSHVQQAINRGDTFLLNLTFPTSLETNLNLNEIFDFSHALYKLKYKDQFVVFSPEAFITIQGNNISCYPMKGTIDAAIENAEERLMTDIKETSEHNTIVDLIRNDLSMVAKKVKVEKFRYLDKIKTHERELLQTSSKITGELTKDWREKVGDILYTLLPAGSISGAPKQKTLEIITEAEGYERGWFTGVFGYFDGKNLDSAVMIRYIEKQGENLIFKSGGGITWFSKCEQEYNELVEKVYVPIN